SRTNRHRSQKGLERRRYYSSCCLRAQMRVDSSTTRRPYPNSLTSESRDRLKGFLLRARYKEQGNNIGDYKRATFLAIPPSKAAESLGRRSDLESPPFFRVWAHVGESWAFRRQVLRL